jgi:hypothetical protein
MAGEEERALLGVFLRSWKKDQEEGITLRSVHNRVTGAIQRYDQLHQEIEGRVIRLEARNDFNDKAEQTGRFRLPEPSGASLATPMHPFPPPGANGMNGISVHVNSAPEARAQERRDSHRAPVLAVPWWSKPPFSKALGYALTAVVAIVLTWIVHLFSIPQPRMLYTPTEPAPALPSPPQGKP